MNSNLEIIVNEILNKQKEIAKANYQKSWEKIKDEYRKIWDEENKELLDIYGHDLIMTPKGVTLFEGKKVMQIEVGNVLEDGKKIELLLPGDIKMNGKDYTALYESVKKYIGTVNKKSTETEECTISQTVNSVLWEEEVTKSVREIQETFWSNLEFSQDPEIARLEKQRALEVLQNINSIEFDDETALFIVTTREGKEIKISEDDKNYGFMFLPLLYVDAKRDGKLNANVTLDDVDVVLKHPKEVINRNKEIKNNGGTPIQTKPNDTKDLNSKEVKPVADIVKEAFDKLDLVKQKEILKYNEKHKKKIDQGFFGHLAGKATKPFKNGYERIKHCKLVDWAYYVGWAKPREIIGKLEFTNFKDGTLADITGKEEDKNYRLKLPSSMLADIYNKMNSQHDADKGANEQNHSNTPSEKNNELLGQAQQNVNELPPLLTDELIKTEEKENNNIEPVGDNSTNDLGEENNYVNPSNEEEPTHEKENNEVADSEPISKPVIEPTIPLDPKEAMFQEIYQLMQRKMADGTATSEDFQKMTEASLDIERYRQQKKEEEERLKQEEERVRNEIKARRAKEAPEIMVKNQMIRLIRQEIESKNYSTTKASAELERRLQETGITKEEYDAGRAFYKDEFEQIEQAKEEQRQNILKQQEEILMQQELRLQEKNDALREMIEWEKLQGPIAARSYIATKKQELGITEEDIEQAQKIYEQEMANADMIQNATLQQADGEEIRSGKSR